MSAPPVATAVAAADRWQVVIPAPCDWISANDSSRWERARLAKQWRDTAYLMFRGRRLPRGLARVRVEVELHFRDRGHRDEANYHSTVKPVVDALGPPFVRRPDRVARRGKAAPGLGVIPDDTPAHLDGPHLSIGRLWPEVCTQLPVQPAAFRRPGGMTVTITDLSGASHERA